MAIKQTVMKRWEKQLNNTVDSESKTRYKNITNAKNPWARKDVMLEREDERMIAQMRAGSCPLFRSYLYHIKEVPSPLCQRCSKVEDEEHVVCICPKWAKERAEILGDSVKIQILAHSPQKVTQFIHAIQANGYKPRD